MKNQTKRLNKNVLIIIISVVVILLIALGVLIFNNKDKDNKPKDNNKGNNTENLENAKMPDYYSILSYLKLTNLPEKYLGYFYQKDNYSVSTIDNKVKIYMGIRKVIGDNGDKYNNPTNKIELKKEDVEKALISIFGPDIDYKHESLDGNSCSFSSFKYDKTKNLYIQEPGECPEMGTDTMLTEISNIKQEDKTVEIYEKFAYVELSYNLESQKVSYDIYKEVAKTTKVATVDEYSLESCKDQLNTYKYTFKLNNKNYYLESVELVK